MTWELVVAEYFLQHVDPMGGNCFQPGINGRNGRNGMTAKMVAAKANLRLGMTASE